MFLRQKNFKNKDGSVRSYAQIVQSRRVEGVSKHVVLMDLGRIDMEGGKRKLNELIHCLVQASETIDFLDVTKDLKSEEAKEFGPELIFRTVWEKLGLKQILDSETKPDNAHFDISDAIFNMVLNRVSAPSSKRQLEYWQDEVYGIKSYELHQYYRAMDYLIEHKDAIEKRLFYKMRDLFSMEIDVVLFDTTTIVYYGEGCEEEDDLLAHGFSKDRRSDLKQVVVGVMMSKHGVPLGHEVFSGNSNDVTCFKQIITKIKEKFSVDKVVIVGDRGMINAKNVQLLEEQGYEYILGFRMRTLPREERGVILSKENLRIIKKDTLHWKEVNHQGKRLIVCYNPERAISDAKKREELLERIKQKIKGSADIKILISNQDYKRFLKIEGKSPRLDEEKIAQDALYDGVFVITSNTKMSPGEIIEGYKDLWQVEMGFRQLKSELEMGPMYHWRETRIRAHIMICFLGLILRSELYRLLKEKYKTVSYPRVLKDIKALKVVSLEIKGEPVFIRTEFKPGAMQSIKALQMRSPARVLFHESKKQILV